MEMGAKKNKLFRQLLGFTLSLFSIFSISLGTSEWSVS